MAKYWRWFMIIAIICLINFLLIYISLHPNEDKIPKVIPSIVKQKPPLSANDFHRESRRDASRQVLPPPNVLAGMRPQELGAIKEPLALVRKPEPEPKEIIPIVVIACNREGVKKCLDQLFKYRPSRRKFPIIVSQDCGHKPTEKLIESYGDTIIHIRQPNLTDFVLPRKIKNLQGYYKISRHYKFAMDEVFMKMNYSQAVIVEDDLNIAPDFFEYFAGTLFLLTSDPSLYCVSAWNDNGKPELIMNNPKLLYRTDFFPGLGWMLLKSFWLELRPKWPNAFWDDYLRQSDIRKGRACIRPEISRTTTFGQKGVSNGLFYNIFLRFIKLNSEFVPFTQLDLTYLHKSRYDAQWQRELAGLKPVSINDLSALSTQSDSNPIAVVYNSKQEFIKVTKQIGAMTDHKSGVPRTAYMGAVLVMHHNHKVYILPPANWKDYDAKWT